MGSTREGSSTQYQTGVEVADSENCTRLQSAVLSPQRFYNTGPWWLGFFDLAALFGTESQHKISVSRRGLTSHSSLTNQLRTSLLHECCLNAHFSQELVCLGVVGQDTTGYFTIKYCLFIVHGKFTNFILSWSLILSVILSVIKTLALTNPQAYNRICTLQIRNVFIVQAPGFYLILPPPITTSNHHQLWYF
jgi:hypothetical protein